MQITFMGGVEWMLFFLASLLLMLLAPWYAPKIGFTELRRIPKIDVLDDVVKSNAERGRPVLFTYGGLTTGTTMESVLLASANTLMARTAKTCGDLGIDLYTTAMRPQAFMMMVDSARQGFMESAHPENYRDENNYFTADGIVGTYYALSTAVGVNAGTYIQIGYLHMCSTVCVLEGCHRIGATSWCMNNAIDTQPLGLAFADYALLGEEQVISGPYLKNDADEIKNIIGGDMAKLVLIGIMVVYAIRYLAGV